MFISQASFEGHKGVEQMIFNKLQKSMNETIGAKGLVSAECWSRETKDNVEYVFVTKWDTKEDFKLWVSREDHVEGHKEMNKYKGQEPAEKAKKTIRQYEEVIL
ncbi:antibiotic biosynthesis monooxygenase family protein [Paenibacillus arenilitoris]|uniref:Antibiotic biosynthesis monooxygenase n=1 Tax=Paenibacillus arenilitoris TaxID=2772299 RepID=A0A927H5V5_9BACL|nr:antibiotic biosynthesis monooxygenase [Paenibacillus arenilitoris]MBD2868832.1 antibiotic biosynthesis monooxygenase [Paenibacillus arenilitoris]